MLKVAFLWRFEGEWHAAQGILWLFLVIVAELPTTVRTPTSIVSRGYLTQMTTLGARHSKLERWSISLVQPYQAYMIDAIWNFPSPTAYFNLVRD